MNDDGAHFCAECGQRFSPAGPPQPPALGTVQPGFSQPPGPPQSFSQQIMQPPNPENQWNQMPNSYNQGPDPSSQSNQPLKSPANNPPEQPKKRLHSPILGGGYEDEPEPEPESKRGRGSMRGSASGVDAPSGKPKHLRSPLLGGDDGEDDFDNEPRRPSSRSQSKSTKGGLRSPLLGGADEDDYEEPQARGGFPRRSRDIQDEEPPERGSARGLRSPLLGGGDDEDDSAFSTLRRTNKPSGSFPNDRRSRPEVWDPGSDQPSGKPRRLRSSLLGGGDYNEYDDYDDEDEEIADPKALRSPLLRAVTSPHDQPAPLKGPAQQQPSQPQPAPQPFQQAQQPDYSNQQDANSPLFRQPLTPPQPINNYAEPAYQTPQMQQPYSPPQPPAPAPSPQPQHASSPFARNAEEIVESAPLRPGLSTSNMPTTVKPAKPARFQPEEAEITSRPSFDKFASDSPSAGGGGTVSPALAGLVVLAIILKGWNFITYPSMWNQPAYVADQFGQVLVMVSLILVVMGVSKGRG